MHCNETALSPICLSETHSPRGGVSQLSESSSRLPDISEANLKGDSNQGIGFLHFWIPSGQLFKASMGPL
jgi:hypothetical protein